MPVFFNKRLKEAEEVRLSPKNRAFAYGDGLFETMIVRRGTCSLLSYHLRRLQNGAGILQLELPFGKSDLESMIWQLAAADQQPLLRMRLQVWRKSGGLYTPEEKGSEFLLSSRPFIKAGKLKNNVRFSKKVLLSHTLYSGLKTMNALPYVLAGLEKKERKLDDLIITNQHGQVAECCAANLFWLREGIWYTPALESGCIAGVMRAYLLDQMRHRQIPVEEVLLEKDRLMEAEAIVGCNVTGLYSITQLEGQSFQDKRDQLSQLIQLPEL